MINRIGEDPCAPPPAPTCPCPSRSVTLEAHPHISTGAGLHASIHPCKHAAVMQKLTAELVAAGRECRPEQYLFLFLKFISAVCPTIEYDYTISVDGL